MLVRQGAAIKTAVSHFPEKGVRLMGHRRRAKLLRFLLRTAIMVHILLPLTRKVY